MAEDARDRFAALVAGGGGFALDEACVLIAAASRSGLDVARELARLDSLAKGLRGRSAGAVARYLCEDLGFTGDRETYHDARNSLLPEVLDRRRGIPISLAIVAIEVGRRCGVPLAGVGMPGHFLVRDGEDPDVFIDLFDGGVILDAAGCRRVFAQVHPRGGWDDSFLAPVDEVAIVVRVLANLANAHRRAGDGPGLIHALELRLLAPGPTVRERRELAVLLGRVGQLSRAAAVLEGTGEESDAVAAARLRARLN